MNPWLLYIINSKSQVADRSVLVLLTLSDLKGTAALFRLCGCKNRPSLFPGQMSYKETKPARLCLSSLLA